jgi:hypothetical protein
LKDAQADDAAPGSVGWACGILSILSLDKLS